jgi:DNA-binding MarR family transcriptional regulator
MEEPLAQALTTVTKKYLYELSKSLMHLSIDRYHYVLVLIDSHHEALSQKALAELLHIDKSYMVSMLDYLGDNGYIIREKNPHDRREQLIRLTSKARTDLPIVRRAIEELNNRSLRNISDAEKKIFMEVLHSIQNNLLDIVPEGIG